jgi:hypothetical protein
LAYGVACLLPAVRVSEGPQATVSGFACLASVPIVMIFPGWWANPLLFAGCASLRRYPSVAVCLGLFALGLAATELVNPMSPLPVAGYWVWLASIALLPVAGLHGLMVSELGPDGPGAISNAPVQS